MNTREHNVVFDTFSRSGFGRDCAHWIGHGLIALNCKTKKFEERSDGFNYCIAMPIRQFGKNGQEIFNAKADYILYEKETLEPVYYVCILA